MNQYFRQEQELLRLLRCTASRHYFTGSGWSPDIALAKCFPNSLEAVRVSLQQGLKHVEYVLRNPDEPDDLCSFPLN